MDSRVYVATGSDDGLAKVWVYQPEKSEQNVSCHATLAGHTAGITSMSWNPRSKEEDTSVMKHNSEEEQLLTSSKDQTLKIWRPFSRHGPQPHTIPDLVKFDPDDVGTSRRREKEATKHQDYINMACWRPKGSEMGKQVLSCSDDCTAAIWDVATGEHRHRLKSEGVGHTGPVSMATWSPDGKVVLTCGHDKICLIWNPRTGHIIKMLPAQKDPGKGHTGPIWSAKFAPLPKDGGHSKDLFCYQVVTASKDCTARLWDANTGQCITTFDDPRAHSATHQDGPHSHKEPVFSANWNPGDLNQILTCSLDGTAKLWDKRVKKVSKTLDHHQACVWSAVFGNNDDGRSILTSSHDMTALVYDQRLDMPKHYLTGHTGILWQASFSDDDRCVVTCSEDRTARLWNLTAADRRPPSFRLIDPVHPHKQAVTCAAFRPPVML